MDGAVKQEIEKKYPNNPSYSACAIAEGFCEGEGATSEQQIEAWAYIAEKKLYLGLQGFYGRNVQRMVEANLIDMEGNYYPNNLEGLE